MSTDDLVKRPDNTAETLAILKEHHSCSSFGRMCIRTIERLQHELENERMKVAGCSTAAIGYWKEGDSISPDYDCAALRDVARLYQKHDAAQRELAARDKTIEAMKEDAERYRWLNSHCATGCLGAMGRFGEPFMQDIGGGFLDRAIDAARSEGDATINADKGEGK